MRRKETGKRRKGGEEEMKTSRRGGGGVAAPDSRLGGHGPASVALERHNEGLRRGDKKRGKKYLTCYGDEKFYALSRVKEVVRASLARREEEKKTDKYKQIQTDIGRYAVVYASYSEATCKIHIKTKQNKKYIQKQ